MRTAICSILALTALATGCTDDGGERCDGDGPCFTEEATRCLAQTPTIDTGFYGCVFITNDVGEPWTSTLTGNRVQLFPAGDRTAPAVVGISNELGFYQLAPPPGAYQFCTGATGSCSEIFGILDGGTIPVDVKISALVFWEVR